MRYSAGHEETRSFVALVSWELNGETIGHGHYCVAEEWRSFVALFM